MVHEPLSRPAREARPLNPEAEEIIGRPAGRGMTVRARRTRRTWEFVKADACDPRRRSMHQSKTVINRWTSRARRKIFPARCVLFSPNFSRSSLLKPRKRAAFLNMILSI